ncbi:hypothetical protein BJ165DRAFT_1452238 [Panaeolus papilionaceus]|nr:hypothetical protein BJ165DRAFT_1452238 [Panaeolus papilionaceus]
MGSAIFPMEIFGLIIDQHQNMDDPYHSGQNDLKRFCSISKGFARICQPYIFQHITLDYKHRNHLPSIRGLVDILAQRPHLLTYIQIITINLSPLNLQRDIGDKREVFPDLPCFPMLQNLNVVVKPLDASYKRITDPDALDHHLLHHCLSTSTSTLRGLSLCGFADVPITQILSFPKLDKLVLVRCQLDKEDQPAPSISSSVFPLTKLQLVQTSNLRLSTLRRCGRLEAVHFYSHFPIRFDDAPSPIQASLPLPFRVLRTLNSESNFDWPAVCAAAVARGQKAFPSLTKLVLYTAHAHHMDDINCIFHHLEVLEVLDLVIARTSSFSTLEPFYSLDVSQLMLGSIKTLEEITIRWKFGRYSHQLLNKILDAVLLLQDGGKIKCLTFELAYGCLTAEKMEQEARLWTQFIDVIDDPSKFTRLQSIRVSMQLRARVFFLADGGRNSEDVKRLVEEQLLSLDKLINHPKVIFDGNFP